MTDDRSIRAAEYALGLEPRLESDAAFAEEAARWHGRFAPLFEEIAPADAPRRTWSRIERSLGAVSRDGNVVALKRKVTLWQGLSGAMTALAASLAIMLLTRQPPPPAVTSTPPMVAMIKAGADVAAVASWDSTARRLLVSEVKMPVVSGRDYQLWLLALDGRPHSVGVMPNSPHMAVALAAPMAKMVAEGATLAVSLEPVGGSRSAGPSGPVVASGPLSSA